MVIQNESGALNESFSDIFGTVIEYYAKPQTANWIIGEEITPFGIRNMSDPNSLNAPDTYNGQFWYSGDLDKGGVHTNSGVGNYWFYLLAIGGSGTNDFGDSYSVSGISIDSAALIAYRTLTVYLTPNSDYYDAREYSIQAAEDLFGPCSPQVEATMDAWNAVGLGGAFSSLPLAMMNIDPTTVCFAPATVQFHSNASGAFSYDWDFGDGAQSTDWRPVHEFQNFGSYDITLIVTGCNGIRDTLENINGLNLQSTPGCSIQMPQQSFAHVLTESCSGTLMDTGGPDNYPDNLTSTITIAPPGAGQIILNFSLFDLYPGGDYLGIYDRPDENSPLIGIYGANILPNGGIVTSTGPEITLKMSSNVINNGPGFELNWDCSPVSLDRLDWGADIKIFPNPANNQVIIQGGTTARVSGNITLVDVFGNWVHKATFLPGDSIYIRFDLDRVPSGIYWIEIESEGTRVRKPFIIQK